MYRERLDAARAAAEETTIAEIVAEAVAPLRRDLDAARQALAAAEAERDRVRSDLAERDLRVGELTAQVTMLRRRVEQLEAQLEQLRPEPTPGLWYRRPEVKSSVRTVDVHLTPWFTGLSRDTQERFYLDPHGEKDKHIAYGGLTRDLMTAYTAADEVAALRRYGVDGVYVDIVSASHWPKIVAIADAAIGTGLHVMPMIDANGSLAAEQSGTNIDPTAERARVIAAVASRVKELLSRPTSRRLPDGRHVVGLFRAEGKAASWWSELAAALGVPVAFVGAFNDTGKITNYPLLWAAGAWSPGADPAVLSGPPSYVATVRSRGQIPLIPILTHNVRPNGGWYDESRGLAALRASWDVIVAVGDCLVQGVTGSDIAEGSHMLPSALHGESLLAYNEWRSYQWRTGELPPILAPAVFVSHRPQLLNATITSGQSRRMVPAGTVVNGQRFGPTRSRQTPSVDEVEIMTLLPEWQDGAEVEVVIGGQTRRYRANRGEHVTYLPAAPGPVTVRVAGIEVTTPPILTRAINDNPGWLTVWSGDKSPIFDPRPAP